MAGFVNPKDGIWRYFNRWDFFMYQAFPPGKPDQRWIICDPDGDLITTYDGPWLVAINFLLTLR